MHVLVAGCGWLGREIARRLVTRGDRVTAIVRSERSAAQLRADGLDAHALDLTRQGAARELPPRFDGVVAACSASGPNVSDYRSAYVDATRALLGSEAAVGASLVYVGSTRVFGQRDGSWVDEGTAAWPTEPLAEVLVEAERLVLDTSSHAAMPRVVRCSALYGPGRCGIVERVRSGASALDPGNDLWMNFIHRDDAARIVIAGLDRGRPGAIYHASDAAPEPRHQVIAWIAAHLGQARPRLDGDRPATASRRSHRRISSEATLRELGVRLAYPSFREGLAPLLD